MYQTIRYEKNGNIGIATINRPEALNALNSTVISELEQLIGEVEKDAKLGAFIITGEGRSFVAGADIGEQSPWTWPPAASGASGAAPCSAGSRSWRSPPSPQSTASLWAAAVSWPWPATSFWPRGQGRRQVRPARGGPGHHPRLLRHPAPAPPCGHLQGQGVDLLRQADRCAGGQAIGLVNEVYAAEELLNKAVEMAKSFTVNAPIAVKYSKACIDRGMQMDIDNGIALENELFAMCFATADQKEGMGAFLEKRKEKHFQNK